jgi:hypothetical protein
MFDDLCRHGPKLRRRRRDGRLRVHPASIDANLSKRGEVRQRAQQLRTERVVRDLHAAANLWGQWYSERVRARMHQHLRAGADVLHAGRRCNVHPRGERLLGPRTNGRVRHAPIVQRRIRVGRLRVQRGFRVQWSGANVRERLPAGDMQR